MTSLLKLLPFVLALSACSTKHEGPAAKAAEPTAPTPVEPVAITDTSTPDPIACQVANMTGRVFTFDYDNGGEGCDMYGCSDKLEFKDNGRLGFQQGDALYEGTYTQLATHITVDLGGHADVWGVPHGKLAGFELSCDEQTLTAPNGQIFSFGVNL